jgi:hypothetical protein
MPTNNEFGFPLTLTQARRRLVAELIPHLSDRLKIEEAASRTIRFTSQEVQHIVAVCKTAIPKATKRKVQDGLQYVTVVAAVAEDFADAIDREIEKLLGKESGWLIFNTHGLDDEGWGPIRATYLEQLLERRLAVETVEILPAGKALEKYVS